MLWDMDYDSTDAMMKDMGVSLLMSDGKATNRCRTAKSQPAVMKSAQSCVTR